MSSYNHNHVMMITNFRVLMRKAKALADARKAGDPETIAKAQADHDTYRDLVLASDQCQLGCTYGALDDPQI